MKFLTIVILVAISTICFGQNKQLTPISVEALEKGLVSNKSFRLTMLENNLVHYKTDDNGEYWGLPKAKGDTSYAVYFQKMTFPDGDNIIMYYVDKKAMGDDYVNQLKTNVQSFYPKKDLQAIILDEGTKKERKSSQIYHYKIDKHNVAYIRDDDDYMLNITLCYTLKPKF